MRPPSDHLPSKFTEPEPSSQGSDDEVDEMIYDEVIHSSTLRKRKTISGDSLTESKPAKVARVSDRISVVETHCGFTIFLVEIMWP
jgi:hypothetical protein